MNPPDASSAASRLCGQCGMCCNGVMFHTVWLQPGDKSAGKLMALGLKLKFKKKQHYLLQPCAAHNGSECAIYMDRPARCRLFECRQLKRIAKGEITEAMALEKIQDVKRRVGELNALLARAGETNLARPLSKRCDHVTAEPADPADLEAVGLRHAVTQAMEELDALLDNDFRIPKS
jgi:Fe-S-cluster containining protein